VVAHRRHWSLKPLLADFAVTCADGHTKKRLGGNHELSNQAVRQVPVCNAEKNNQIDLGTSRTSHLARHMTSSRLNGTQHTITRTDMAVDHNDKCIIGNKDVLGPAIGRNGSNVTAQEVRRVLLFRSRGVVA
jgi:hypothetical protein